jgi:hypothetical protein
MTGIRLASFIGVLLALAQSSSAAPITWAFEGRIRGIGTASPSTLATLSSLGVVVGSPFSGFLVFESSTPASQSQPTLGLYPNSVLALQLSIGTYHVEMPPEASERTISVTNTTQPLRGEITAFGIGNGAALLLGTPIIHLSLVRQGGAFPTGALPVIPPALSTLASYSSIFPGGSTFVGLIASDGQIAGELTSLVAVPEPRVGSALSSLALALFALRRR